MALTTIINSGKQRVNIPTVLRGDKSHKEFSEGCLFGYKPHAFGQV